MVNYWTTEKEKVLKELVEQGVSLADIHKRFPINTMKIIFEVRKLSSLQASQTFNKVAQAKARNQKLTKREAFSDSYMLWDECDCIRLKAYFFQVMSIEDIYLNLGRTYSAVLNQMSKLYPREMDRQKLYEKVAFYVKAKPLSEALSE